MQQWPKSERMYKNALSAPCDTWAEPHIQFELIKITVDEFGGQLMKLCEEEFLALTPSGERQYYTGNIFFVPLKQNLLIFWPALLRQTSRSQNDARIERQGTTCSETLLHQPSVCLHAAKSHNMRKTEGKRA